MTLVLGPLVGSATGAGPNLVVPLTASVAAGTPSLAKHIFVMVGLEFANANPAAVGFPAPVITDTAPLTSPYHAPNFNSNRIIVASRVTAPGATIGTADQLSLFAAAYEILTPLTVADTISVNFLGVGAPDISWMGVRLHSCSGFAGATPGSDPLGSPYTVVPGTATPTALLSQTNTGNPFGGAGGLNFGQYGAGAPDTNYADFHLVSCLAYDQGQEINQIGLKYGQGAGAVPTFPDLTTLIPESGGWQRPGFGPMGGRIAYFWHGEDIAGPQIWRYLFYDNSDPPPGNPAPFDGESSATVQWLHAGAGLALAPQSVSFAGIKFETV